MYMYRKMVTSFTHPSPVLPGTISWSSTLSNHVYLSIDIILVYLKAGMNQWSVLSQLLFGVVMDVVPSEARSGKPSELLCADDLVLTAPIMERLGRRIAE